MKKSKKAGTLSQGQAEITENIWKEKALSRGKENNALKKRIKELTHSRDNWKLKCQSKQVSCLESTYFEGKKAKFHQYSLILISLLLDLSCYGSLSFRGCRHSLSCLVLRLGLECKIPSHTSIRNWSCKHGYNRVKSSEDNRSDVVLYVDESIVFGSEKILLILGIDKGKIALDRAVCHSDIEVLYVGYKTEWKAASIEAELVKIGKNRQINYVVSDEGLNLKRAYKSCNYTHIEDCTHILANFLKKIYGNDANFESFRSLIGNLRQGWNLSKSNSKYMPPSMRGKMRFANIFPCVDWAEKCLKNWGSLPEDVRISLTFIDTQKGFIDELVSIGKIFKIVCQKLKTEGFVTHKKDGILKELEEYPMTKNVLFFVENIKKYFKNLSQKSIETGQTHLLCSSDIIESFFGKFKAKLSPNSRAGLTEFIYTMANFSGNFSENEVKKALENVKIKDLKQVKSKAKET